MYIFNEESLSSYSSLSKKLTIKFEELFKSWIMAIPYSHQKSFSSMFVNLCLIRLPKKSVSLTKINLTTEFLKSEKLKEYSLSSQS